MLVCAASAISRVISSNLVRNSRSFRSRDRMVAVLCAVAIVVGARAVRGQEGQEDRGRQEFSKAGCAGCHGPSAKGGEGPALAGMSRPYPEFVKIVREGTGEMPPHSKDDVSDEQLTVIYKWLVQLSSQRSGSEGTNHEL